MSETDKPIPAIYPAFALMVGVLCFSKSFAYALFAGLVGLIAFANRKIPEAKS